MHAHTTHACTHKAIQTLWLQYTYMVMPIQGHLRCYESAGKSFQLTPYARDTHTHTPDLPYMSYVLQGQH